MEKRKKTEEELKEKIYKTYTKYHEEPDQRQVCIGQLWDLASKWCKDYLFFKQAQELIKETNGRGFEIFKEEMGLEIFKAVKGCAEKDKMAENVFFPYLYTALVNAINEYYHNCVKGPLRIPVRIKKVRKNIVELTEMWESEIGRELKDDEFVCRYSKWKQISEEEAHITYLESMKIKFKPNSNIDNDGKRLDVLDEIESPYPTPQDETLGDSVEEAIKNEMENLLNKKHDKTKDFYRAIYTIHCINENIKYYRKLWPILDSKILENYWKTLTVPYQYEIYMKYHPGVQKSTAEANASQMSRKFFADLGKAIKEKYPELKF